MANSDAPSLPDLMVPMLEKVYIAAPYPVRDRAVGVMQILEGSGIEVTSRWLKAPDEMADEYARQDLEDVARADALIALNPDGWENVGTGGRHVELGYALALGKPVVLCGIQSNIFHYLSSVVRVESEHELPAVVRTVCASTCDVFTRERAIALAAAEFLRAERKHKPMNSPHEGYAVILEELDELWAEVKADRGRMDSALLEATHVAAMGLRYLYDMAVQAGRSVESQI